MAQLTTQQAAEMTGKSRSTIWRTIKAGKVSAERTESGDFLIDVAELERAFGPMQRRDLSQKPTEKPIATTDETNKNNELEIELATLRERTEQQTRRIADMERERDELRRDRDKWQAQAEGAQRLLTDQRDRQSSADQIRQDLDELKAELAVARRPWWRRWKG
jgi:excisionase family DNA binding protein